MKKFASTLVLLFVLSVSAFAEEGQIPIGGRTCPQGQTCFTNTGDIPNGGKSEQPIYQDIFDYLKSIFG
jgi:hypothetical protein